MHDATTDAGAREAQGSQPVAVSVLDVSMVYDGVHAVRDASFDLPRGRFLTILGPSGSGKTTLLRLIAGFQKPTKGDILINGTSVNAVPPHKRSIGMVFQRLALFPHMTAAENVAFPLKMRRTDARKIPERVDRYLDLVKLGGFGQRRIHELSGGQQQRVAIARALVFEPDLLLLDEPLAALDRKLREEMQLEFRRIQRELGVTTINVTHDQREALVVSDEIIVMDHGVIQQKAEPSRTYRSPRNAFVASFIGVTNFIAGDARSLAGDTVVVGVGESEWTGVIGDKACPLNVGAPVRGAIRAEQIRIARDGRALEGAGSRHAGIVSDAIFEGERVVYEVRLPDLGDTLMRVFDHGPHDTIAVGDEVYLGWNPDDVLVFDDEAGHP
ncbi:ABC transporter ATP-binding protein [Mesorhizobium xinjiangense]|uniref:ABC transporter ATP-binding protein n=1 Tax=Mesorhizobium xinjiangense TaxID=2678685 RepID=UPI001F1664E8|nr:ABC transporter ATP-binding protein [Mesorhizobium xinjiangense]